MVWVIEVYVPRLPCACNPNVAIEPALIRFQEGLLEVKRRYGSALSCSLYSLSQNLAQFRSRPELVEILRTTGEKGLPAVYINGRLAFEGEYPSPERLQEALEAASR
jgi:hypothetical protein